MAGVDKSVVVLYFGYVWCGTVCSPILQQLALSYQTLEQENRAHTAVVFANLTPQIPRHQPQIFADAFNKEFVGVYLNKRELSDIEREFALFYSQGLTQNSQMTHSDLVYLLTKERDEFTLKNIYTTHPLNTKSLINDIKSVK